MADLELEPLVAFCYVRIARDSGLLVQEDGQAAPRACAVEQASLPSVATAGARESALCL